MQRIDGHFIYSATDLNNDLECRRLTWLDRQLALGDLTRPDTEPALELIAAKGDAHEARYRDTLLAKHGGDMVVFASRTENTLAGMHAAEAETFAAMARGAKVIYQATFFDGTFLGRADFLIRVETPSAQWPWSYEVVDTKLALTAKPYFLLQLCNYSEHVERLQGTPPVNGHIVFGSGAERAFRIADYAAYYRHQKRSFLARAADPAESYPDEVSHCGICRWTSACTEKRERDEYLGLVAWMRTSQIERLAAVGIATIPQLAAASDEQRPYGMSETTFATLRAQAALQHRQRVALASDPPPDPSHFHELIEHDAGTGFDQLPEPNDGDVYFDMEGDPLYTPEGGLEYLFGVYLANGGTYRAFWARSLAQERAAFEALIDFLVERREAYPRLHVYHYAPYETVALRRLMGHYGTRESELDDLLRGQVFVDLFAVVRQTVRISQPSYSIKKLEAFYGMARRTDVKRGDDSIVMFEKWLAEGDDEILEDIERYNEDDCLSTYLLHGWLLERRTEFAAGAGREVPWRAEPTPKEPESTGDDDALAASLLDGLPPPQTLADLHDAADGVRARWLLGNLLQYHRREAKPAYWKMFDRYENTDRLAEFDHEAIGDMRLRADIPAFKVKPTDRLSVYTYEFPDQQHNLGASDPNCPYTESRAGTVIGIDDDANLLQLKLAAAHAPASIRALIPGDPVRSDAQKAGLRRIAEAYVAGTLSDRHPAVLALLLRSRPRMHDRLPGATIQPPDASSEAITQLAGALDGSFLFIQGPPGTGKSTKAAGVIVDLLAGRKRVGVVSGRHKAVHSLLHKVEAEANRRAVRFSGLYKHSNDDQAFCSELDAPLIRSSSSNSDFADQPHDLAGGTPWLFAREELTGSYDVLFIDEAGQISLADALACAASARNVVLLGDPLQLAQVSQGSHPTGTALSILEHLLGDDHTVAPDRGVFLDVSHRMHPAICAFVSDAVYDGRLTSSPATAQHRIASPGLTGSGLRFIPVTHSGNSRESREEADALAEQLTLLLAGNVTLHTGAERPLTSSDVLVVTPYNAQRRRIDQTLVARGVTGVRVGTVDKFQGQQAAVIFYSMATSSGEDMPRNMAFLFEPNRFNVAISRAQCMSVLVCSPDLMNIRCRTPQEMELASLLCAFVETATA